MMKGMNDMKKMMGGFGGKMGKHAMTKAMSMMRKFR